MKRLLELKQFYIFSDLKLYIRISIVGLYLISTLVTAHFILLPGPDDYNSYLIASWAMRDGKPFAAYSSIIRPNSGGLYYILNSPAVWRNLIHKHLNKNITVPAYLYPPSLYINIYSIYLYQQSWGNSSVACYKFHILHCRYFDDDVVIG